MYLVATLTVLKFPTAQGAETMLNTLENLQKQQLIQIEDGAIVTWPEGAKKPKTKQLTSMTGVGALGGAFWDFCLACCSLSRSLAWRSVPQWVPCWATLPTMGSTRCGLRSLQVPQP